MPLRRLMLALTIAVLIAGVSTFWFSRRLAKPHKSQQSLQYVATQRKMAAGEILTAGDLQTVKWPDSLPLQGAIENPAAVVGKTLLYPLAAGEPILEQQITASEASTGLAAHIPNGMRAVSLKSDQVVGVAGYLLPGTHVDVLVTFHNSAEPVTSTVLQDAQILTAGQKMQPDPEGKPTPVDVVTLLVTPQDAERVVLASTQGTMHFVLRSGTDRTVVTQAESRMSELTGNPATPVRSEKPKLIAKQAAPVKKSYVVEVIRGQKQSTESFE
jgi:pilus assembly protein CpaB